jgi:formylmethanofuran dehydrogenase subunit E
MSQEEYRCSVCHELSDCVYDLDDDKVVCIECYFKLYSNDPEMMGT